MPHELRYESLNVRFQVLGSPGLWSYGPVVPWSFDPVVLGHGPKYCITQKPQNLVAPKAHDV